MNDNLFPTKYQQNRIDRNVSAIRYAELIPPMWKSIHDEKGSVAKSYDMMPVIFIENILYVFKKRLQLGQIAELEIIPEQVSNDPIKTTKLLLSLRFFFDDNIIMLNVFYCIGSLDKTVVLITADADDTGIFESDLKSIVELINTKNHESFKKLI